LTGDLGYKVSTSVFRINRYIKVLQPYVAALIFLKQDNTSMAGPSFCLKLSFLSMIRKKNHVRI
jgi:hypothetical protein